MYTERLEQYFIVNDLKPELHMPRLRSCIDEGTYELTEELCTLKKPITVAYKELVSLVKIRSLNPFILSSQNDVMLNNASKGKDSCSICGRNLKKNLHLVTSLCENL